MSRAGLFQNLKNKRLLRVLSVRLAGRVPTAWLDEGMTPKMTTCPEDLSPLTHLLLC